MEKPSKTRKEIMLEKEQEVREAKKPAYIYETIDWCEKMKNTDNPIYEDDYEKLEDVAMDTLLKRIEQSPSSKKWSTEMKKNVNTHLHRLRHINNQKIKKLEEEYLAAQKAGQSFKLKEIEKKINDCKLFAAETTEAYKKINSK